MSVELEVFAMLLKLSLIVPSSSSDFNSSSIVPSLSFFDLSSLECCQYSYSLVCVVMFLAIIIRVCWGEKVILWRVVGFSEYIVSIFCIEFESEILSLGREVF